METDLSIHETALLAGRGHEMTENGFCKGHSGFDERIKQTEENMKALWAKWDRMQLTLFGIFAALVTNLLVAYFKG